MDHSSGLCPSEEWRVKKVRIPNLFLLYLFRLLDDLAATEAVKNLQDQESQNLKPNEVLMNQSFRYPEVLS